MLLKDRATQVASAIKIQADVERFFLFLYRSDVRLTGADQWSHDRPVALLPDLRLDES